MCSKGDFLFFGHKNNLGVWSFLYECSSPRHCSRLCSLTLIPLLSGDEWVISVRHDYIQSKHWLIRVSQEYLPIKVIRQEGMLLLLIIKLVWKCNEQRVFKWSVLNVKLFLNRARFVWCCLPREVFNIVFQCC